MTAGVLLTCEHAGNRVPAAYKELFRGASAALASHRGWDPGSLDLARVFRRRLAAPLIDTQTTRLLVEVNRSLGHPRLFSEFTSGLDLETKQEILDRYYHPHRRQVESWFAERVVSGGVAIQISLHTFTPELHGEVRTTDIGLLYDPRRPSEKRLCRHWQLAIQRADPELRVRKNYPYRGNADGLTTHLRRQFDAESYLGIELEVNQCWLSDRGRWRKSTMWAYRVVASRSSRHRPTACDRARGGRRR